MTQLTSAFDPTDTGHAGAFLRRDGVHVLIHIASNPAGQQGWYWCEAVNQGYTLEHDAIYLSGKSGMGPYSTCREACHAALAATSLVDPRFQESN